MKFIQRNKFTAQRTVEHLLLPFFNIDDIKSMLQKLDMDGHMIDAIAERQGELTKQALLLPIKPGSIEITFMDLGCSDDFNLDHLIRLFKRFGRDANTDCQIMLDGLEFKNFSIRQAAEAIIRAMLIGAYSFSKEKLKEIKGTPLFSVREQLLDEKDNLTFTLISNEELSAGIDKAINFGKCINYARMLGDIPNNYLHVKQFARYTRDLSKEYNLKCEILGKNELEALHCGGILGVNAGSGEEPNLITIYYEGSKGAPYTALIGKGVMFDSGGYHLKPIEDMYGMKYDMCGAADVLSVLEIAVRQRSSKNILAVIPAVENVIGPSACKMGDVLTTMSGKTVEVYNPDAEGRLIMCDAITYAIKKGAGRIIDIATLTNSCHMALGNEISGIFSNNDELFDAFAGKTKEQCENVWRLPLDEVYRAPLHNTETADLINYAPGSGGGASVAACFLEEFVERVPWIHLDIVGTAVKREKNEMQSVGATGVLIASISSFLE